MLQQATHLYSNIQGTIIGHYPGKRAHLIRLSTTGKDQLWREDSTIIQGDSFMKEETIRLKLISQKNHPIIERYFNTQEEASQYLYELKSLNDLRNISSNGLCATISNGWNIQSNYDIRELLKKKSNTMPSFDIKKALEQGVKRPSNHQPVSQKSNTGKIVRLQDLTKDTRKARVILRGLVRQKKIIKPNRWEWAEGSSDLQTVRAALKL